MRLRSRSDPTLLWLWCRLAAAAPIRPLAWELPYTTNVAQKQNRTDFGVPNVAQWVKNLSSIHEDVGLIPSLAQWVKDPALL